MTIKTIQRLAIFICILFTIGMGSLAYVKYHNYKATEAEWQAQKNELQQVKNEIAEIEQMLAQYEKEKEEFAKYLFNERDIPSFLDEISKYARDTSVDIVDMKTQSFQQVEIPRADGEDGEQVDPATLQKEQREAILTLAAMPIDIELDGSFENLVKFFDQLQNYKQLLNVSDVAIETTREYPVLNCKFTLKIFSLKTLEELRNI